MAFAPILTEQDGKGNHIHAVDLDLKCSCYRRLCDNLPALTLRVHATGDRNEITIKCRECLKVIASWDAQKERNADECKSEE